jgi:hypothetical protein
MKSSKDLYGGQEFASTDTFNMYEVGLSDPNQIRPREFKYLYRNVPVELSKTAYDKLNALTQASSNSRVSFIGAAGFDASIKKSNQVAEYIGYG